TSCTKKKITPAPDRTIYTIPVRFVTIRNKGAYSAYCAVHWGANGTSSSVHYLDSGTAYTWDLSSEGIPAQWRFWASINVIAGKYIDSNKDRFYYDPKSTKTVVFTLQGTTLNPYIM
ncbi:MAG: hypothetical protein JXR71_11025, partial [Bacteroidales bacterium]|nr:hypothetical protein [Bacteroidales bacterium]